MTRSTVPSPRQFALPVSQTGRTLPRSLLGTLAILALSGAAYGDPVAALTGLYPDVRTYCSGERQMQIYGARMTPGQTPAEAAADFLAEHGDVFGVANLELNELWRTPSADGRWKVFAYRQQIRGKEVDGSVMRIRVRTGVLPRVDYSVGRFAREPVLGSEEPIITAEAASLMLMLQPGYGARTVVGEPEHVVLLGEGTRPDAWTWRILTVDPAAPMGAPITYYVNTATAQLVHVRDESLHASPTTGTVRGSGTPLADAGCPWCPYDPNATTLFQHTIPRVRVTGTVGTNSDHVFTNGVGEFVLALGTTGNITLGTGFNLIAEWYQVVDDYDNYLTATDVVPIGSNVPLELDHATLEADHPHMVAQVDTVVTLNRAREFFKQYISATHQGLSVPVVVLVNLPASTLVCNGGFSWPCVCAGVYCIGFSEAQSLPNLPSGEPDPRIGCWNYGNHSVAAHESGHLALTILQGGTPTGSGGFQEGYADCHGVLLNDYPVQGPKIYLDNSNGRDDPTSSHINCQYPLGSNNTDECHCNTTHNAGQLLSGVWVRILSNYKTLHGSAAGLEAARVAFGSWSLITTGADPNNGCNTAYRGTLIEVLSVVDDLQESDLICKSFSSHSITCVECCTY